MVMATAHIGNLDLNEPSKLETVTVVSALEFGESEGHPFRGNQWTSGTSGDHEEGPRGKNADRCLPSRWARDIPMAYGPTDKNSGSAQAIATLRGRMPANPNEWFRALNSPTEVIKLERDHFTNEIGLRPYDVKTADWQERNKLIDDARIQKDYVAAYADHLAREQAGLSPGKFAELEPALASHEAITPAFTREVEERFANALSEGNYERDPREDEQIVLAAGEIIQQRADEIMEERGLADREARATEAAKEYRDYADNAWKEGSSPHVSSELYDRMLGTRAEAEIGRREALFSALQETREFADGENLRFGSFRPGDKNGVALDAATRFFPADWVRQSNQGTTMDVREVSGRGYYSRVGETQYGGSDLRYSSLPTSAGESYIPVMAHELGHRVEHAVPGIVEAEKVFYERRTEGESLTGLGRGYRSNERTRADEFFTPYVGKDYGGRNYEVVSMGMQELVAHGGIPKDPEHEAFVLGLLALHPGTPPEDQ